MDDDLLSPDAFPALSAIVSGVVLWGLLLVLCPSVCVATLHLVPEAYFRTRDACQAYPWKAYNLLT